MVPSKLIGLIDIVNKCDPRWLHFGADFVEMEKLKFTENLDEPLYNQFRDQNIHLFYYDALHLGKNLRYYLSNIFEKCIWASDQESTISKDDFIACGIDSKLFDDMDQSKCYDVLALHLFNSQNIKKCRQNYRYDLAFSLLIMTLLFETKVKLLEHWTRNSIYLLDLDTYKSIPTPKIFQREIGRKNIKKQCLMQKNLVVKYLFLTYSLIRYISLNTPVNIGALGSHLLENFFGMMRRVSTFEDNPQMYTWAEG